jgi:AraC family transcriptional regulator
MRVSMASKLPPGTFLGRTDRRIAVSGLTFVGSAYSERPGLYLPRHSHEDDFLELVIQGVCEEIYGRQQRIRGPSTLAFYPAGEPHSNRWRGTGGRVFHIDLSRDRAESIRQHATGLDRPFEFDGGVAPWLASRLYREYQRSDGPSVLAMEGLTLEILAEACRYGRPDPERAAPRWLLRARDLMHDRFRDDLTLGEIAAAVDIHPAHLARTFRRHFGTTLGDYLRRLRVDFSSRKLATTDSPLSEIAVDAGFADQSHFTKTFRTQMGMTPGEFRRNFRSR